jgi:hypothetical protein
MALVASPAQASELSSSDAEVRARAARTAGAADAPRLLELLADPHWKVRAAVARALGRLRHKPARRDLKVRAQTDTSAAVREAAAEAVRRIDPDGFISMLATSDKPPVRPAPPPPREPDDGPPRHALLFSAGAGSNALSFTDALAGQAATGLRWRHADVQLTLSFPSLAAALQVRVNIVPWSPVCPYVTGGGAIAYNNTVDLPPAGSLFAGGGVRVGPLWRGAAAGAASGRGGGGFGGVYGYVEVLANWVMTQGRPAGVESELETFSLPVLLGVGVELWP